MKKFGIILSLLLSAVSLMAGNDNKIPVKLIVGLAAGIGENGLEFLIPQTPGTENDWHYTRLTDFGVYEKEFSDIVDDTSKIEQCMSGIYEEIKNATDPQFQEFSFNDIVSYSSIYALIMSENNRRIQNAMLEKWATLSNVDDSEVDTDKKIASAIKESGVVFNTEFKRWTDYVHTLDSKIDGMKNGVSSQLRDSFNIINELKTRLETDTTLTSAGMEQLRKDLAVVIAKQDAFTKEIGILQSSIDRLSAAQASTVTIFGSGILSLPDSVIALSNQMDRVSTFFGSTSQKDGYFHAPAKTLELPEGVAFQEEDYDGEQKGDTVNNVMQYFWQNGFMPFLPIGASLEHEGLWKKNGKDLFFSFSEGNDGSGVSLSANDIPAPTEWADTDNNTIIVTNGHFAVANVGDRGSFAWMYDSTDNRLHNCFVQVGRTCLAAGNNGVVDASTDGDYYAVVTISEDSSGNGTKTVEVRKSAATESDSVTSIHVGTLSGNSDGSKKWVGILSMPIVVIYE